MIRQSHDDFGRMRFVWPEPLVIDIVHDHYAELLGFADRMTVARLQADALRDLFEGRDRHAMATRLELVAFSGSRGIGPERIARADHAVFLELARVVAARFRTSRRSKAELGGVLQAALDRLAKLAASTPPRHAVDHAEAA